MNSLLLLFLALPLFVQGREQRRYDSRERVPVGADVFSGQYQPIEQPRRQYPVPPSYPRPSYNPPGAYGAPASGPYSPPGYGPDQSAPAYPQYPAYNGPSYGNNEYQYQPPAQPYPVPAAQPYPVDNSPSYPVPAAQPYSPSGPY